MWITTLQMQNIRGYSSQKIEFSNGINVIVGQNNAGKTTILKSLFCLQESNAFSVQDVRMHCSTGTVDIGFGGDKSKYYPELGGNEFVFSKDLASNPPKLVHKGGKMNTHYIAQNEPKNFIYPYLSKRKVAGYHETMNLQGSVSVTGDFQHLYPKIDRISNPEFPAYDDYVQACDDILGFRVSCAPSHNGKKGVYTVENFNHIPIDAMGEGVANLLGIIVDLCVAEDKLFLIEEPENDIHPKALKKLLGLISQKAANNQFVITTHSNIVTKYLGAQENSKIFNVNMMFDDRIPTSTVEHIKTPQRRREVLEDLGYEMFDFDLWKAWLFLEESSAEKIIRDFVIPFFVPELQAQIKTFSAHSISEVEAKFADFNNLFVFLHLQPSYKNKVWLIIDGGDEEKAIIERMQGVYSKSNWDADHFQQFHEHDFEKYYPDEFQEEVTEILALSSKQAKRKRKKQLLNDVVSWCNADPKRAKEAFKNSAGEVIEVLQGISEALNEN